jgi:hypothetical protein
MGEALVELVIAVMSGAGAASSKSLETAKRSVELL